MCYIKIMATVKYSISIKNHQEYIDAWQKIQDKVPFTLVLTEIRCKYCNSKNISKFGIHKNIQRWWCKECKRKFADNQSFPGTKMPLSAVHSALLMYYKGVPLKSIRQQLEEEFNCYPSDSTIYRLIQRLTVESLDDVKNDQPKVGDTWLVYESTIVIAAKEYWILDLVDSKTHFLLASAFSPDRNLDDIRISIESARGKAQKIPEVLVTKRMSKYLQGIELALGATGCQINIEPFPKNEKNNFSSYWHRMQKKRRLILHNLKLLNMAQLILEGWMLYYNYYLDQKSLNGKTPSQAAEIQFPSIPKPKAKSTIQVLKM